MLVDLALLPIERLILSAEQATLSRGHVVRLAARPPYYRCSCGSRYSNPREHVTPTPPREPWYLLI